ncbi:MAG: helix-turn-helix transcriptional regulator [Caulobacter sp.]|nr:helix-turn-helix transcriptional regulator [Caulobacter sp.]
MPPATNFTETSSLPFPNLNALTLQALGGPLADQDSRANTISGALTEDRRPSPPIVYTGGLAPWQVKRLMAHLVRRLDAPLRLPEIAALVGVSASHFSRAFKQTFGQPFSQYVIALRLERARTLLRSTRQSISDVALACGMTDQAHLTRLFHRRFGAPPHAWRRAHGWPGAVDQAEG